MRERFEHRGLTPMKIRRFRGDKRIPAIVEMSVWRLHVLDRPSSDFLGEGQILGGIIRKVRKSINGLRAALDIDRISSIVVVARTPGRLEEDPDEEVKAPLDVA